MGAPISEQFSTARQLLEQAVAQHAFPGAACLIGHKDQLAGICAGRLTYDTNAALVTLKTIYDLASLTKAVVTTTAAMLLVERGLLVLDRTAGAYLPDFLQDYAVATDPLWTAREEVTVRHLLTHTSGLPAYEKFFLQANEKSHLLEHVLELPLEELPGTRTLYSDIGFILLGEIIERIVKESLASFAAREIFAPLSMSKTCFNPPQQWKEQIAPTELDEQFRHRLVWGEVHDENAYVMGGVAGHAGLFGTVKDLAEFCLMMLNEGVLSDGKRWIKRETIREFTREHLAEHGAPRGLGWDKPSTPSSSGRYFSRASYGHLGYTGTSIWIDPAQSLFVILLTNRVHPSRNNEQIKTVRPALHDAIVEALT